MADCVVYYPNESIDELAPGFGLVIETTSDKSAIQIGQGHGEGLPSRVGYPPRGPREYFTTRFLTSKVAQRKSFAFSLVLLTLFAIVLISPVSGLKGAKVANVFWAFEVLLPAGSQVSK